MAIGRMAAAMPAFETGLRFERIVVPTPFAVGPANVYVTTAEPFTLIDAGTNTPETAAALMAGLDAARVPPERIERIVITHGHPDHYGLAPRIRDLSGADVMIGAADVPKVVSDGSMMHATGRLLLGEGVPVETLIEMGDRQRQQDFRDLHPVVEGIVPLHGGETLSFDGFDLRVLHMPGHTAGHVCLFDDASGVLFSGDTLLPNITPNPLLEPSPADPSERRRSLVEYVATLERLAAMPLEEVFPGHGPPIEEPHALIEEMREHHRRRSADLESRLTSEGKTTWQLANELFPSLTGFDNFLAVSEVVGHMDLLVDEGRAEAVDRQGVIFYQSPSAA
jgi:glyoxylase-like metal-dependent hydrolase (beta-lactamase superfamily II)